VNLSFLECYKTLDIVEDCDWTALRKKYKTLIQQCHPDRFPENSTARNTAEEEVRLYNAAYKQISDYYRVNKRLPPRSDNKTDTDTSKYTPRKKKPPIKHVDSHRRIKSTKKIFNIKKAIFILLAISSFFLLTQYKQLESIKPPHPASNTQTKTQIKSDEVIPEKIGETTSSEKTAPNIEYFSIGSSVGEVILTQGEPTHIENNTWYYGESSVTYNEGIVSDWYRHPLHPLNAKIKESSSPYQFTSPDIGKSKSIKKPYWNR